MNVVLTELAARIEARLPERVHRAPSNPLELTFEVAANDLLEVGRVLRDELKFEMLMDVCGVDYLHYGRDEWKTYDATDSGFSRGVARGSELMDDPVDSIERFDPTASSIPASLQPSATGMGGEGAERLGVGHSRFAVVYHLQSISQNLRLRLRTFCPDNAYPMVDSVMGIWSSADWFERETFDLFGILFRGHPDLRRILTDYGFVGHPFRKDFPLSGNVEVRYDAEKKRVVYQPVSIEPRTLVPKVIREDNRYTPDLHDGRPQAVAPKANP